MKSTYLQFTRLFFALGTASLLGLSSCSKSETSAEAEEAVEELDSAADEAISKVEEAVAPPPTRGDAR